MSYTSKSKQLSLFQRACCLFLTALITLSPITPFTTQANDFSYLPKTNQLLSITPNYNPPILKGIQLFADNPFKFNFIIDQGDGNVSEEQLKQESQTLIRYFLAGLTIPEEDLWVNLSPNEPDRIIPNALGLTDLGQDMLGQDYILKQLASSLTYPENYLGKKYWDKIYQQTQKLLGTTKVPIDTFNKIWVAPDKVTIYEDKDKAFIDQASLKVMLEDDYKSNQKPEYSNQKAENTKDERRGTKDENISGDSRLNNSRKFPPKADQPLAEASINKLTSDTMKQIVLPEITREVNKGKNFSKLRQIYNSLLLATWFKQKLRKAIFVDVRGQLSDVRNQKEENSNSRELAKNKLAGLPAGKAGISVLEKIYIDKNKIKGVDSDDPKAKEKIYNQYLEAYKQGIYSYIKKDIEPNSKKEIKRKYYSGGLGFAGHMGDAVSGAVAWSNSVVSSSISTGNGYHIEINIQPQQSSGNTFYSAAGESASSFTGDEIIDSRPLSSSSHNIFLGGQVLFSSLLNKKAIDFLKMNGGRINVTEDGKLKIGEVWPREWSARHTAFDTIDSEFQIFDRIVRLARFKATEPVFILDWGAGDLTAARELSSKLNKVGINNVNIIAFGDIYDKSVGDIPSNILFIVDLAKNLPSVLKRYISEDQKIDMIYSYAGLTHIVDSKGFEDYFKELSDLVSDEGLIIFDRPIGNDNILMQQRLGALTNRIVYITKNFQAIKVGCKQNADFLATIQTAERVLNRPSDNPLTDEQKEAIWQAHLYGDGKLGKPDDQGIYHDSTYTSDEQREKSRILREAGFSFQEIVKLKQYGVVGKADKGEIDIDRLEKYLKNSYSGVYNIDISKQDTYSTEAITVALNEAKLLKLDFHNINGEATTGSNYDLTESVIRRFSDCFSRYPYEVKWVIRELVKNAFVHGNKLDFNLPIYFYIDFRQHEIMVYDFVKPIVDRRAWQREKLKADGVLWGFKQGVGVIKDYGVYKRNVIKDPVSKQSVGVVATVKIDAKFTSLDTKADGTDNSTGVISSPIIRSYKTDFTEGGLDINFKSATIQTAERVLNRQSDNPLTEPQKEAIWQAHLYGEGQLGSPDDKGHYPDSTYKWSEKMYKYRILRQAGFTQEEVGKLMRYGVVGEGDRNFLDYLNLVNLIEQYLEQQTKMPNVLGIARSLVLPRISRDIKSILYPACGTDMDTLKDFIKELSSVDTVYLPDNGSQHTMESIINIFLHVFVHDDNRYKLISMKGCSAVDMGKRDIFFPQKRIYEISLTNERNIEIIIFDNITNRNIKVYFDKSDYDPQKMSYLSAKSDFTIVKNPGYGAFLSGQDYFWEAVFLNTKENGYIFVKDAWTPLDINKLNMLKLVATGNIDLEQLNASFSSRVSTYVLFQKQQQMLAKQIELASSAVSSLDVVRIDDRTVSNLDETLLQKFLQKGKLVSTDKLKDSLSVIRNPLLVDTAKIETVKLITRRVPFSEEHFTSDGSGVIADLRFADGAIVSLLLYYDVKGKLGKIFMSRYLYNYNQEFVCISNNDFINDANIFTDAQRGLVNAINERLNLIASNYDDVVKDINIELDNYQILQPIVYDKISYERVLELFKNWVGLDTLFNLINLKEFCIPQETLYIRPLNKFPRVGGEYLENYFFISAYVDNATTIIHETTHAVYEYLLKAARKKGIASPEGEIYGKLKEYFQQSHLHKYFFPHKQEYKDMYDPEGRIKSEFMDNAISEAFAYTLTAILSYKGINADVLATVADVEFLVNIHVLAEYFSPKKIYGGLYLEKEASLNIHPENYYFYLIHHLYHNGQQNIALKIFDKVMDVGNSALGKKILTFFTNLKDVGAFQDYLESVLRNTNFSNSKLAEIYKMGLVLGLREDSLNCIWRKGLASEDLVEQVAIDLPKIVNEEIVRKFLTRAGKLAQSRVANTFHSKSTSVLFKDDPDLIQFYFSVWQAINNNDPSLVKGLAMEESLKIKDNLGGLDLNTNKTAMEIKGSGVAIDTTGFTNFNINPDDFQGFAFQITNFSKITNPETAFAQVK